MHTNTCTTTNYRTFKPATTTILEITMQRRLACVKLDAPERTSGMAATGILGVELVDTEVRDTEVGDTEEVRDPTGRCKLKVLVTLEPTTVG